MNYTSKREKIREFLDKYIANWVKEKDLDYYKIVDLIKNEIRCDEKSVIEVLDNYVSSNLLKEIRLLTIPDEKINEYLDLLKKQEEKDKQTKQDLEDLDKMIKEGKN
jgi:uncharacterized membrane protein